MVKLEELTIVSTQLIAAETIEMTLHNAYISQHAIPGQFLHISVPNHTLRRPISIANIEKEKELITIIFKVIGSGTSELATYKPGQTVNALGPCGNGFSFDNIEKETILLIGGGVGVPPLHYLGQLLSEKNNVISILGFQSAKHVFYEEKFSSFSKTIVVTDDGSYGEAGFVTDILDKVGTFDQFYSCGPLPMLKAVTDRLSHKRGYISLEERMGCGVGACFACVIPTHEPNGYRKICQDGPVFAAQEVVLS